MYTPVFREVPSDWRERWRLIRTFVGRLYGVDFPGVGRVPKRQVNALEARLGGRRLPPSVVEWMAFAQDVKKKSPEAAGDMWEYRLRVVDLPEFASISLNMYQGCMQWGVAYEDFDQDDPPVSAYAYVEGRKGFVLRKSYGRAPVTQFALDSVLYQGWSNLTGMGAELKDPKRLLASLRKRRDVHVGQPFGSLTFIEGTGWFAYVLNGYSIFGREKLLTLRFAEAVDRSQIPQPIRTKVGMKLK